MEPIELRMRRDVVERLRLLGLRLGFERGRPVTWADLTREGADLVLEKYAGKSSDKAVVAVGGGR